MTAPFLHATWVVAEAAAAQSYRDRAGSHHVARATAAYVLQPKSPVMQSITGRLDHMDVEAYPTLPTHVVLTELDSLDDGLAFDADRQTDRAGVTAVVRGLYAQVAVVEGTLGAPDDGLGAAIQLGTFNMRSADDEWAVSEWYRDRRLASFAAMAGGHRARRLVSVCGGPAKLGIFYEFRSLADRAEHFEPLETVDHDEDRPTAAARTVHPPMSPSVGALLE
jgi:hypothetical protein